MMRKNIRNKLGLFSIVMMMVSSVDSLRNLSATAIFGSSLIIFFIIAAIAFLIPVALVSADLGSIWSEDGGVYLWVKKAFGCEVGMLAVWFQWIENIIWYPTVLSFIAGTIAYAISPSLANNRIYLVSVILIVFWVVTYINLKGLKLSALISNLCCIAGLLIPMQIIICFGIFQLFTGKQVNISFSVNDVIPNFHQLSSFVSITSVVLCLCGIEMASVHASDVKESKKTYPKALVFSVIIILSTLILGGLSIAIAVPHNQINLISGIMQAISLFFNEYHLAWVIPVFAILIALGSLGGLNNWVIAPTRGMAEAAKDLKLPLIAKENKRNVPSSLLIAQGVLVSIVAMLFLFVPSINKAYWIFTALTSQLYMSMYLMMFVSAIYLRFKYENIKGAYQIPFGRYGMLSVAGLGCLSCLATIAVGFLPPSNLHVINHYHYEESMLIGFVAFSLPPFLFILLRKLRLIKGKRAAGRFIVDSI